MTSISMDGHAVWCSYDYVHIVTLLFKLCMFPFVNEHIHLLIHVSRWYIYGDVFFTYLQLSVTYDGQMNHVIRVFACTFVAVQNLIFFIILHSKHCIVDSLLTLKYYVLSEKTAQMEGKCYIFGNSRVYHIHSILVFNKIYIYRFFICFAIVSNCPTSLFCILRHYSNWLQQPKF